MDSQVNEVRDKLNILDIVGSYVRLTKAGVNYRGLCPFHSEKTPSFFVSPTRQTWHCFGCGAGYSVFDFVMKIEGVEFGDALRILAGRAGVQLKKENPQIRTERQRLYEICELATLFFEKQIGESSVGKEAKDYLLKRGIVEESLKKWRVGYSPDTWGGLTDFLIGKGYKREEVVRAGLAITKENNKDDSYDRFRGRIIFPVFDLNSQVIGFGGRVFKQSDQKEAAKYINTPQTLLYDKSGALYGLNFAKLAARKQNQCVVTEGYTDVILCHQAGFENTVAASGTALTQQHLRLLKRYSDNLALAFDMDLAGDSATKRGIDLAQEQGFNIKIVETGVKDSDPADIVAKDPKLWEDALNKAKSIMDYYFDSAFSSFDKNTPEGKREIGKIIVPVLRRIQNKIEQSHWIQKFSEMVGVREEAAREELAKVKSDTNLRMRPNVPNNTNNIIDNKSSADAETGNEEIMGGNGRKKVIEEKIITIVLRDPNCINLVEESNYELFSEKTKGFLREIKGFVEKSASAEKEPSDLPQEEMKKNFEDFFRNSLAGKEADVKFKNFLVALALRADFEGEEDGESEMKICLRHLRNLFVKDKLSGISEAIKKCEAEKDLAKTGALIEEFNRLSKDLLHQ